MNNTNYFEEYTNLIKRAKSLNRSKKDGSYYERHHIVPKCLGGSNDSKNLVFLTFREHVLAHLLLHKMYPNEEKLLYAFNRITGSYLYKNQSIEEFLEEVTEARIKLSRKLSERNKKNWSDPVYAERQKARMAAKVRDPEERKNISARMKERWGTKEARAFLSETTKKQMSDPNMKTYIQKQRLLNFYKSLRNFGFIPTAYSWNAVCKEYVANMPKYTHAYSLDTITGLFGRFEEMIKQAGFSPDGLESLYAEDY